MGISCDDFDFILKIVGYLFTLFQWIIPIALIVLITIDVVGAMLGGDEKKTKDATSKAGKRLLYAVIIFLIPLIVRLFFKFLGENASVGDTTSWISCFNAFFN